MQGLRRGGGGFLGEVSHFSARKVPFCMFREFLCEGSSEGAFRFRCATAGRGEFFGSFIVKLYKYPGRSGGILEDATPCRHERKKD